MKGRMRLIYNSRLIMGLTAPLLVAEHSIAHSRLKCNRKSATLQDTTDKTSISTRCVSCSMKPWEGILRTCALEECRDVIQRKNAALKPALDRFSAIASYADLLIPADKDVEQPEILTPSAVKNPLVDT